MYTKGSLTITTPLREIYYKNVRKSLPGAGTGKI